MCQFSAAQDGGKNKMNKRSEDIIFSGLSPEKLQFGCLAWVAVMEFLYVVVFSLNPAAFAFPMRDFLMIPALAFVGTSLLRRLPGTAVRRFLLGGAMVGWVAIAQWIQRSQMRHPTDISMWTPYLLAFPFAAATKDRDQKGLRLMGAAVVVASVVSALYGVLLTLDILPVFLAGGVFWDYEGRLQTMMHPAVSGWLFMVGIAFCLGFLFRIKNKFYRCLLVLAIVVQLLMQSLTNYCIPILMTCAMIAGAKFFSVSGKGRKRWLQRLLATGIVFVTLFVLTDFSFNRNFDKLVAHGVISEMNNNNGLPQDLKNLAERIAIWKDAWRSVLDSPHYLVRGTTSLTDTLTIWEIPYTHNAWLQAMLGFGLPALLLALWFTFLAVRGVLVMLLSGKPDMWQRSVAMLVAAMLIAGTMEPYLFTAYRSNHLFTVTFMLCIGYLEQGRVQLKYSEMDHNKTPREAKEKSYDT